MAETSSSVFRPDAIPYLHQAIKKCISPEDYEYCRKHGFSLKLGHFMPDEDERIKENFRLYVEDHPHKSSDWLLGFNEKANDKDRLQFLRDTHFHARLAHGLNSRPADSVRQRARKILHRYARNTFHKYYTPHEMQKLIRYFAIYGKKYMKLSELMQRTPASIEGQLSKLKLRTAQTNPMLSDRQFERLKETILEIIREKNKTIWMKTDFFQWHLIAEKDLYPEICQFEWRRFTTFIAEKYLVPVLKCIKRSGAVDKASVPWEDIVAEFNLCNVKSVKRLFKTAKKYFLHYRNDVDFSEVPFIKIVKKMAKFFKQLDDYARDVDYMLVNNEKIVPKIGSVPEIPKIKWELNDEEEE